MYVPINKNIAFADLANQIINQYPVEDMSFVVLHLGQPQGQQNVANDQYGSCTTTKMGATAQAENAPWFGVIFPNPANAQATKFNQFVANAAPNNNQL